MTIFSNIRGTLEQHFRISLGGPTLYFGSVDPAVTPPTALDGNPLNPGDLYIRTGATSGLYVLGPGGDTDWDPFQTSGGSLIVGGDLAVGGEFSTADELFEINSGGGATAQAGFTVTLPGDDVRWVWEAAGPYWRPDSSDSALNNVYVPNDLIVDGDVDLSGSNGVELPPGTIVNPSLHFSGASSNTGLYSPSTDVIGFVTNGVSRWIIDSAGNFVPTQNEMWDIGAIALHPAETHSQYFRGGAGTVGLPSFAFSNDNDSGMYQVSSGVLGFSGNGTQIAQFHGINGEILFSNLGINSMTVTSSTGDANLIVETTSASDSAVLRLRESAGNNWSLLIDDADADNYKMRFNDIDRLVMTGAGLMRGVSGTAGNPTYSFIGGTDIGMFLNVSSLSFATAGLERFQIDNTGLLKSTTALYETLVVSDNDIPNRKFVLDNMGTSNWKAPARVRENTSYANLAAAEAAMNGGTVDGVSILTGDRILYTNITGEDDNIYVINGTVGAGATLVEEAGPILGDTVYIIDGTDAGKIFSYDVGTTWSEVSGSGGGGGFLFAYESQTAGAAQTLFNLAITYVPTGNGSRLVVYVNGVKQVFGGGAAYTETSPTAVTFNVPFAGGEVVEFYALVANLSGVNLNDAADVDAATPLNDARLTYNSGTGNWEAYKGQNFDELVDGVSGNGPTIFNTVNVTTIAKTGVRAYQQVFVNGILQKEGPGFNYTVTGANQITFTAAVPGSADVTIYQL